MEAKDTEKLVYPKALKCFKSTTRAIDVFRQILEPGSSQDQTEFYRARKLLRDGEDFFKQAIKNAKRLLGPLPEYVTSDYQKWRKDLLSQYHMLAQNEEQQALTKEVLQDEFLKKMMDNDEIKKYLSLNYDSQKQGQRKLANIKVRIIFDKLNDLLSEAKEAQKKILQAKQQS
ncbi:MAG: hypothetical protein GF421_06940 [Candidatus Aminicenantes bacterium]|nr:hypothetical protein [Candidatus Aminicenantes bacterium]